MRCQSSRCCIMCAVAQRRPRRPTPWPLALRHMPHGTRAEIYTFLGCATARLPMYCLIFPFSAHLHPSQPAL